VSNISARTPPTAQAAYRSVILPAPLLCSFITSSDPSILFSHTINGRQTLLGSEVCFGCPFNLTGVEREDVWLKDNSSQGNTRRRK